MKAETEFDRGFAEALKLAEHVAEESSMLATQHERVLRERDALRDALDQARRELQAPHGGLAQMLIGIGLGITIALSFASLMEM